MKIIKICIIASLLSVTALAIAHQNHDQLQAMNISQSEAIKIATNVVRDKIGSQEINDSWASVESNTAALERMNGRQVWKITFYQTNEDSDAEGLEVTLSRTGDFISVSE